jgi:hypothetical protein
MPCNDGGSLRNARQERFDFLGYSFGPHRFKANGEWYLSASPSKKSIQRSDEAPLVSGGRFSSSTSKLLVGRLGLTVVPRTHSIATLNRLQPVSRDYGREISGSDRGRLWRASRNGRTVASFPRVAPGGRPRRRPRRDDGPCRNGCSRPRYSLTLPKSFPCSLAKRRCRQCG